MKILTVDGQWWEAVDPVRARDVLADDYRGEPIEVTPVVRPHTPDTAHPLRAGGFVASRHVIAWSNHE